MHRHCEHSARGHNGSITGIHQLSLAAHADTCTTAPTASRPCARFFIFTLCGYCAPPSARSRQVILGGLDNLSHKGPLLRIKDLLITAHGSSHNAAQYGAMLMREIKAFQVLQNAIQMRVTPSDLPPHPR